MEEIAARAIAGWGALAELAFEEDSRLHTVGEGAFRGSGLSSFAAPPSLRTIGKEAFAGCGKLRHLALNEGLQTVGERCFAEAGLTFVAFPIRAPQLEADVFAGCSHIRAAWLPSDLDRGLVR